MYMKARVDVTLDKDLKVTKFDVDMDSLPTVRLNGYETVPKFTAINFDNNQTFYTDSNGLDMQERILNYRPYYNFTVVIEDSHQNITANYYPINSAISLKEVGTSRTFTVMNDRAQGGSSLYPGQIEFMQNRRVPDDDFRGVNEYLNETDSFGNGLRVPATYYL